MNSRRPRAIYLVGHTPFPPMTGGGRRAASIAEVLAEHYDVTVVAADDVSATDPDWAAAARRLLARRHSRRALAADMLEGLVRGQHVLLVRSIRAGVLGAFRAMVRTQRPDLVLLGRPFLGPFIDAGRAFSQLVIVDADESLPKVAWAIVRSRHTTLRERVRALIEAVAVLSRMERSSYPRAHQVWVSAEHERREFGFIPTERIHVVPNVMPTGNVAPSAPEITAVGFVGSYFYPPNEAAALELIASVMPAVRARGGPRRLVLIGPHASPALTAAAARDLEVELLGQVPEVAVPLRAAGILAVPLRAGGGTRIKILEAMAIGVPVVSTVLGIEGLDVVDDRDVLVAETAEDFASQISRLASDASLRSRLVRAAFDEVRARHSSSVLRDSIGAALNWTGASVKTDQGTPTRAESV